MDKFSRVCCMGCGRFLGYAAIENGAFMLLCPKCGKWTFNAFGEYTGLTFKSVHDIIESSGRAKKVIKEP